jgi:uncharacterized membrane protein
MLDFLPEWLQIFILSMVPWWESRYTIPIAILSMGWQWWQAFPIVILGNMLPVPFILLFFKHIEKFLRKYKFWKNLIDKVFAITRQRADSKIRKYEHLGLLIFVGFPVPFTGAWTGSLIAYLFDLKFTKSLITIFIGVITAAGIMTFITLTGVDLIWIFVGILLAILIMTIIIVLSINKMKQKTGGPK